MAELKYIQLYHSYLDAIQPLSDAERGRLFTALLAYGKTGTAPELNGNERFVFPMMQAQIDRDKEAYEDKRKKQSDNIRKRWDNRTDQNRLPLYTDDTTVYGGIPQNTNDTKEKKKEKDNTPKPPPGLFEGRSFSDRLKVELEGWLRYKAERRENYKSTGLQKFLSQVENKLQDCSEDAIIFAISESMASNYQGIVWEKAVRYAPASASPSHEPRKKRKYSIETDEDGNEFTVWEDDDD